VTALQRRILDALASSGGALCTVELRRQVQLLGSTSHLHRALGRLAERGLVVVTQREAWASSGPLIELRQCGPGVANRARDAVTVRGER
jgi:hypothetical protein